jgi:hypothetical protein
VVRGPVGSLDRPGAGAVFEPFDAEGVAVYIQPQVLGALTDPTVVRFYFGLLGWCQVSLDPEG